MRISGAKLTLEQFLLAGCYDALHAIIWQLSNGKIQKPESVLTKLMDDDKESNIVSFDSPEAFERAYMALRKES